MDRTQHCPVLNIDIQKSGFVIAPMPAHQKALTAGEKKLAERLASPDAKRDEIEERVAHDVDCIAGVLTLRGGHESSTLEDARSVFVADQSRVIKDVCRWWREDEGQLGFVPIIHIRALANLAWLKKPALALDFKMRELVALCAATLKPSTPTWKRFLKHLEKLNKQQSLTDDEVVAIIASATSDRLLREAETTGGEDLDATTLDEIIERVKQEYSNQSEAVLATIQAQHDQEVETLASEKARAQTEISRRDDFLKARRDRAVRRSNTCSRFIRNMVQWTLNLVLGLALFGIFREHLKEEHSGGVTTWLLAAAIVVFYVLEATVLRGHMTHLLDRLEKTASERLLLWIDPEAKYDDLV